MWTKCSHLILSLGGSIEQETKKNPVKKVCGVMEKFDFYLDKHLQILIYSLLNILFNIYVCEKLSF